LIALRPPSLDTIALAHLDATTLLVASLVALVTGVSFGVIGAVQSRRQSTNESLKGMARRSGGRAPARTILVATEMALSATLVIGAAMLVRSVIKLQNAPLGFEPKGLYALRIAGAKQQYPTPESRAQLTRMIATRLSGVPGVRSIAIAATPPGWRSFAVGALEIDGEQAPPNGATSFIDVNQIGSGFFSTMGMRLAAGTSFTDTTSAGNQVVINANFARKKWGSASAAIGKRVRVDNPWKTIVGVVEDAATSGPMAVSSGPMLFTPATDAQASAILMRVDGASPLPHVQSLVRGIDPLLVPELLGAEHQIARSVAAPRFVVLLLTTFTGLALALAAIGLYGVMSYLVAEQTREIGIRVALGATRARIARSIIVRGMVVAVAGSAAGVAAAIWGTKLIEHQLYGVDRSDIVSFAAAIVVLSLAALVACIVPTRRALAVDPMTAIRAD
jgi:putative ABC transport system permease protein